MALTKLKSTISSSYNKVTGTEYIYETTIYFDDELNQKVRKRKVIGKKDPTTGETISTGKRGRKRSVPEITSEPAPDYKQLYEQVIAENDLPSKAEIVSMLQEYTERICMLENQLQQLKEDIAVKLSEYSD